MTGLDAHLARLSVSEIQATLNRRQTVGRQTALYLLRDPRAGVRALGERYMERIRASERERARVRRLLTNERELLEAEGLLRGERLAVVAGVDEAGLAGQGVTVLDHPHDVARATADPGAVDDHQLAGVSEDLDDVGAQPACGGAGIQLRLDDDPTADQMQPPGEPEGRGDLRLPAAGLGDLDGRQLRLHLRGHGHC